MRRFIFCSLLAFGLLAASSGAAQAAVDPVAKCQSSKLKAWAKLRSCEHKASAKEVTGGTVDPTACQAKFDTAIAKAGTGCRYLDNGDGTVTDLDSGLMWQKTDDAGGLTDKDNTYSWTDESDADYTDPDGTAFTVFLAGLNNCTSADGTAMSGGFAAHCDWRMPQIDELTTILLQPYPCSTDPCIDQSAFGPTNALSFYRSATSYADGPSSAWGVGLDDGGVAYSRNGSPGSVRAVRSGL